MQGGGEEGSRVRVELLPPDAADRAAAAVESRQGVGGTGLRLVIDGLVAGGPVGGAAVRAAVEARFGPAAGGMVHAARTSRRAEVCVLEYRAGATAVRVAAELADMASRDGVSGSTATLLL